MKELKEYLVNENNFFKNLGIGQRTLIEKWLNENCVKHLPDIKLKPKDYVINDDMTIDATSIIIKHPPKELPEYIQFNNVENFTIFKGDKLSTMRGFPINVNWNFDCCSTNITSLDYCPQYVGFIMNITDNKKLKTLKGLPKKITTLGCRNCGRKFTEDEIRQYSDVKHIYN